MGLKLLHQPEFAGAKSSFAKAKGFPSCTHLKVNPWLSVMMGKINLKKIPPLEGVGTPMFLNQIFWEEINCRS
jgi:hypothetical protein